MAHQTVILPAPPWIDARVQRIKAQAILDAEHGKVDRARAAVKYLRLLPRWLCRDGVAFLCDSASAVGEINAAICRRVMGK